MAEESGPLEAFVEADLESQKAARARTQTIRILALAVLVAIGGLVFTNRRLERRLDETERAQVCRIGVTDRGFIAQAETISALGEVLVAVIVHPVGDPEREKQMGEAIPRFTAAVAELRDENAARLKASERCTK